MDHHQSDKANKFVALLERHKKVLWHLCIYAAVGGLLLLSIPLALQSVIGFATSGQVTTSLVVLIGFVVLAVLISGGLQIMQLYLVEHIQQKMYVDYAFDFASRVPKMKKESLLQEHPPEVINRFFDVVSLQKGFSSLLIDFTTALLQIIFGLLLLSFYHPYFIMFGLFLVALLFVIFWITGPKGMETSLVESKYKYKMAHWLQEMARSLSSFKMTGQTHLPMGKTDNLVSGYLNERQSHFKVLITQYFSFVGFKVFITSGLLVLGCILLINREINIGQFVASEIIILLIMTAIEKILIKLDTVYDVLTSLVKLDQVKAVPLEEENSIQMHELDLRNGLSLEVKDLSYHYPSSNLEDAIKQLNLSVAAGERVGISGLNNSGKTTLINLLLGLFKEYEGTITYNNVSLRDINTESLHHYIGNNSEETLFDGTMMDNIRLGRDYISLNEVMHAIEMVGLSDFVQSLDNGLETRLAGGDTWLTHSTVQKILLARMIVKKPKLMILSDFLRHIDGADKKLLLKLLNTENLQPTMLFFTKDPSILESCDRIYELKDGELTETRLVAQNG